MAGLTYAEVPDGFDVWGKHRVCWKDVTFDSSYPTGGEDLSLAPFGITSALEVAVVEKDSDAAPYEVIYNRATGKLQVYRSAGFTPAGTNGTSAVTGTAAGQTFSGSALGTHTHSIPAGTDGAGGTSGATSGGTPAGTNASSALTATAAAQTFTGTAVAAAALVEVANLVNLSALTVRIRAIGT